MKYSIFLLLSLCLSIISCNTKYLNRTVYLRGTIKVIRQPNKGTVIFHEDNSKNRLGSIESIVSVTEVPVRLKAFSPNPEAKFGDVKSKKIYSYVKPKIETPEDSVKIPAKQIQRKVNRMGQLWGFFRISGMVFLICLASYILFIIFLLLLLFEIVNVAFDIWILIIIGILLESVTLLALTVVLIALLIAGIFWMINREIVPKPRLRKV